MMKFRLLQGQHIGPDPSGKKHPDGRPVERLYRRGDVIETDDDLESKFNGTPVPILDARGEPELDANGRVKTVLHPSFRKFQREQDAVPVVPVKAQVVDLSSMSLEKLKEFAEEQEIEGVKDAEDVSDALKIVRTALGAK